MYESLYFSCNVHKLFYTNKPYKRNAKRKPIYESDPLFAPCTPRKNPTPLLPIAIIELK